MIQKYYNRLATKLSQVGFNSIKEAEPYRHELIELLPTDLQDGYDTMIDFYFNPDNYEYGITEAINELLNL